MKTRFKLQKQQRNNSTISYLRKSCHSSEGGYVELKGLQLYNVFRKDRFFEWTKKLLDIIHRNNIKTCQSIKDVKPSMAASKWGCSRTQSSRYCPRERIQYKNIQMWYHFSNKLPVWWKWLNEEVIKEFICQEIEKNVWTAMIWCHHVVWKA